MEKKRILFAMPFLDEGGAEHALVNLLNHLPKERYDIDLLLFSKTGMFLRDVPEWVNVLDTPPGLYEAYNSVRGRKGGPHRWSMVFRRYFWTAVCRFRAKGNINLSRQLRWEYSYKKSIPPLQGTYDIAVGYIDGEILYYIVDKVNAKRKIGRISNDYRSSGWNAVLDKPYYSALDAIISVSESSAEIFSGVFPNLRDRCTVIHNLISPEDIRRRAEAFTPNDMKNDVPAILSIGRLTEQKGYDMAIDAMAALKKKGKRCRFYIMGTGAEEKNLKHQRDSLGLTDEVIFLGQKQNPYPYLKAADIILQSSRWEGKSNVLDEAKVLCKPIVSTAYPTLGDQIHQGEGLVVELSAQGIADGLEKMLDQPQLRKSFEDYLGSCHFGNEELLSKYIRVLEGSN
ncbi:MAG: glycosyltransferase [Clostridia bacterium]|nr:glycosyltransferase [Clostridia bacterium]